MKLPGASSLAAVGALMQIDARRFFRDRFLLAVNLGVLFIYGGLITLVPDDARVTSNIAATDEAYAWLSRSPPDPAVALTRVDDEASLRAIFAGANQAGYRVGLALDSGTRASTDDSAPPMLRVYVDETRPAVEQDLAMLVAFGVALQISNTPLLVTIAHDDSVLLGPKRRRASLKQHLQPMVVLLVLMMEMLAVAILISRDIRARVVHAVVVTPTGMAAFVAAKTLFGTALAFVQALIVAALAQALFAAPLAVTLFSLLGAWMFTALAFLIATRARELMDVVFYLLVVLFVAMLPAVLALLPGNSPWWVQAIPTWPLISGMMDAVVQQTPTSRLAPRLLATAAYGAGLYVLGVVALRNKVRP